MNALDFDGVCFSCLQIFTDNQLQSMSERMPLNQNDLLLIEGINDFKATMYGMLCSAALNV